MVVPSGFSSDALLADWADSVLQSPEAKSLAFALQGFHDHSALAPFEVGLPHGIEWVGCCPDEGMSLDR